MYPLHPETDFKRRRRENVWRLKVGRLNMTAPKNFGTRAMRKSMWRQNFPKRSDKKYRTRHVTTLLS